eukprot:gene8625-16592_t
MIAAEGRRPSATPSSNRDKSGLKAAVRELREAGEPKFDTVDPPRDWDLRGRDLRGASFRGVDLSKGVALDGALVAGVDFSGPGFWASRVPGSPRVLGVGDRLRVRECDEDEWTEARVRLIDDGRPIVEGLDADDFAWHAKTWDYSQVWVTRFPPQLDLRGLDVTGCLFNGADFSKG